MKKTNKKTDAKRFANAPVISVNADYHFSDAEKQALGLKLASLSRQRSELADRKKELMAQINAEDAALKAQEEHTRNKVLSGFESRETNALVLFRPKDRLKDLHRQDTLEFLCTQQMLDSDFEQELPGVPPAAPKPAKPAEKKPAGKKPRRSEPGETSFADLLDAAAAGQQLAKVPVVLEGDDKKKVWEKFRNAAKKAKWPAPCIALMKDIADKADDAAKLIESLNPHTIAPGSTETQEPDPNATGGAND